MHILITSGGTSEAIDSVRSITNHSTGSLGKILAETALAKGHQVTLITTPTALKPDPHPQLRLLLIQNVEELLTQMKTEVPHHQVLIQALRKLRKLKTFIPLSIVKIRKRKSLPKKNTKYSF